jgi:hypothetical protein
MLLGTESGAVCAWISITPSRGFTWARALKQASAQKDNSRIRNLCMGDLSGDIFEMEEMRLAAAEEILD